MTTRIGVVYLAGLSAVSMALLIISGCSGEKARTNGEDRVPVVVTSASRADLQRVRTFTGTVEGIRQAKVFARIPETIVKIHAVEGDAIRAGAPLIEFDESGPGSAVLQARAVYEDARKTAEKFDTLYQQGAVSEIERDGHHTAFQVARANYDAARDAALLTAPISGTVTEIYARVGRQASMGEPLALIASVDTIRLLLDVSVYESKELSKGQRVSIRSEQDTSVTADGWVTEISASADPDSRTISAEVLAPNPGRRLLPGMFVRGAIELERRSQVVSVVRDALVYRESGLGAYVVRDSVAHFVQITSGVESGNLTEIVSGLQAGDQVVVLGQNNLQDGTKVTPVAE
jgi:membrane fusion protein, multidrug efflux system